MLDLDMGFCIYTIIVHDIETDNDEDGERDEDLENDKEEKRLCPPIRQDAAALKGR